MNRIHQISFKRAGLLGIVSGGLLAGLAGFAPKASAQVNPCPGIYYEEPFDSNVLTPEGCPPNTLTQLLQDERMSPSPAMPSQGGPASQPMGQTQYPYEPYGQEGIATDLPPIARVEPMDGMVDVQLQNATNIEVYYEVTGETSRRVIPAQESVYLRNISLPATITAVRSDEGLLQIIPEQTAEGVLEVSLEEDPTFDDTQGVMRIQPDGQVFVN